MKADLEVVEREIYEKRRTVRYDIRDIMIESLVNKFEAGQKVTEHSKKADVINYLYVPDYQRDLTWEEDRQSKLIESIIIGLPIPFIFVAENSNSAWEIVDGSQRIRAIHRFVKDQLCLKDLSSLKSLNGYKFSDLEESRRGKFLNTSLRIIVMDEETTEDVKADMFERINRGSDLLKPMEKRKGIYKGKFTDFIYRYCRENKKYAGLLSIAKALEHRQEREELLVRFFAILDMSAYSNGIKTGISPFLDDYLLKKNKEVEKMSDKELKVYLNGYKERIDEVVEFVSEKFPYGFSNVPGGQTKRSAFEAIAIGVRLALDEEHKLDKTKDDIISVFQGAEFKKYVYMANEVHKKKNLVGRINVIYNMLTGKTL